MKKILVVEDEQMLAKIIGMKLEEEKFEVQHAYDGEEAYTMLAKSDDLPDLVLLDVLLPKMSGFDVMEKLKGENKPLPKIIVFSNFAQKADVERAHALGAIDYIVKAAFSPAEILSKIKSVFDGDDKGAKADDDDKSDDKEDKGGKAEDKKEEKAAGSEDESGTPYQSFSSLEDVMPMSEVLHPGEANNNP